MFLCSGSGDEEMEIYDNDEEGDGDSDGGIEVEDDDNDDDDEIEESIPPVNGDGSSTGTVLFLWLFTTFHVQLYLLNKLFLI